MIFQDFIQKHGYARGILFDLDNTLYAYDPAHAYALIQCHKVFIEAIRPIEFNEFVACYDDARSAIKNYNTGTVGSRSRYLYFQALLERMVGKTQSAEALLLGNTYNQAFIDAIKIHDWVLPFLIEAEKRGVGIAIVTNQEASFQYRKLVKMGIADRTLHLVTSDEVGVEKPDVRMFTRALEKLDLQAADVVMIGDNQVEDGGGARLAGITFYLCGS